MKLSMPTAANACVRKAGSVLSALGLLVTSAQAQSATNSPKWNVLLIISDDLNLHLGCYGDPIVRSPHIDRLAQRGIRFDRAYCQYPLCNPSRASFLSGRRPEATQVFNNNTPPRETMKNAVFLPEYFHQNGYRTARFGKVAHSRFEDAIQWDVSENAIEEDTDGESSASAFSWKATEDGDDTSSDGDTARRAVKWMAKNNDKPFFLAVGFHKPHIPLIAPKRYFDMYPLAPIVLPPEPSVHGEDIPALARNHKAGAMTEKEMKQVVAAYDACVSFMDAQVGLLVDALEQSKLTNHTVVVFMSDNGFHLGEHGLWGKQTLFDPSIRLPLIIMAPQVRQCGVGSPRVVEYVDLYPTLVELCGLPKPKGLEGTSLVPLLQDPSRPWKKAAFSILQRQTKPMKGYFKRLRRKLDHWIYGSKNEVVGRSVCTERYAYVEWDNGSSAQLFDHQTDPLEFTNLVQRAEHARIKSELHQLLTEGWTNALPESK